MVASTMPPTSTSHNKSNRKKKRKTSLLEIASGILIMLLVLAYPLALYWMTPQPSTGFVNSALQIPTEKMQRPVHRQPAALAVATDKDLSWSNPEALTTGMPVWMQDYFHWHAQARAQMKQDHSRWKSFRFLMLQCLPGSRKCGGTADRLKPLPLMIWMARQSKRVLLIKWGRPAELEEFLLPPQGGLDWRVPEWLYAIPEFKQGPRATNAEELIEMTSNSEFVMVKARVQSHDHGAQYYNQQQQISSASKEEKTTFEQVYHVCWRAMFTPAPIVGKLIEKQLQESQLVPGHYVGIHIRALYAVTERDPNMVAHWTRNAIHCASQLQSGGPFYLSSDSAQAVSVGTQYGQERGVWVGSREQASQAQPFHLDKAPRTAQASDFFDTFVDLYLLAMSRCVTYNMGGYGTWALLISPFANQNGQACSFQHHNASGVHKCEWATAERTAVKPSKAAKSPPFLLPMEAGA